MKKVLFLALFAGIALTGIYTVITVYDSNMKFGRLFQTPVIRPHEEPLLVMDNQTVLIIKVNSWLKKSSKSVFL